MKSEASSSLEFENWEILSGFLPEGWSQQARLLGAMQRARYIKEPSVVLRILLMHVALGCSLAETAARAQARAWHRLARWECLSGCVRPEHGLAG